MTSMDTNVNNYTIPELISILGIRDLNENNIMKQTDKYIQRFEKENKPALISFFQNMQTKLLQYINQSKKNSDNYEYDPDNKQTEEWYKNEALPQNNQVQKDKITDRFQKINIYDNNHVPMNREHLGVNNVFDTKVAQDIMNPNLENVTTRFINLDSQFRQASGVGPESLSTNYTLDLSDYLSDVISLRLYSIQIPYTWYAIDYSYGNTCFWVTNVGKSYQISIEPGNYVPSTFITEINTAFQNAGFTGSFSNTLPTSYNANNGKVTINLNGFTDPNGNIINGITSNDIFDINVNPYFTFFDFTGEKICQVNCSSKNLSFNNTLGWVMGFRSPTEPILQIGNTPMSVINLYGPKYFILVIDDYNQNHLNNGLITITELSNKLPLPSYYNPTLPVNCINNTNILGNNSDNTGNLLQDKNAFSYTDSKIVLPTAPRTLTQAQIYTINEIIKNRESNTTYRTTAPTTSDTFALVPIKYGGLTTGQIYVDFSGSLQDNKRIYFGPVNIVRMHVKLLDDKGNIVDLHGADWCITLISENLYQY